MGFPEPSIIPVGSPSQNPPTEETYTQIVKPVEGSEPPAAEAPVTPPSAISEPEPAAATEPEPKVVEKIVEKVVEKYPEFKDERAKTLYEAWTNGDMDAVKNYILETNKNYDTMAHLDVVREGIKKAHPEWTQADVELEIRSEYGKQLEQVDLDEIDRELEPDKYKEAVAHNERVEANMLKLERDARDFRLKLKEAQAALELPKITKETPAPEATGPTQEQLDEVARKWAEDAQAQVPNIGDYKFQVGDDKNPEDVVFVVTPEEKNSLVETMKTWRGADFMSKRGWQNEDGSFNLLNIAKDVHALENMERMVKSAYTQGETKGKKAVIAEDIKNIDFEANRNSNVPDTPVSAGKLVWG